MAGFGELRPTESEALSNIRQEELEKIRNETIDIASRSGNHPGKGIFRNQEVLKAVFDERIIDLLGYSKEEFLEKHLWEVGIFKDIAASKKNFKTLQEKKLRRALELIGLGLTAYKKKSLT